MVPRLQKKDKPLRKTITFRVTKGEYTRIEQEAKNRGFSFISSFVRELILEALGEHCNK